MNDEPIKTPSSKMYNGVVVKTMISKVGNYETEYIHDADYEAYCHWCKLYKSGKLDFNTAMNIIKGDGLQRFYQPCDFETEKKPDERTQKRIDSVIETYKKLNGSV